MNPEEEKKQIEKAQEGDIDAFSSLVAEYEAPLMRFLYRMGINKESSEDILQETCLKLWKTMSAYSFSFPFRSWVYRLCRNEVSNYFRKETKHDNNVAINTEIHHEAFEDNTELSQALESELNAKEVQVALQKLKPEYREVLVLHYFEHLPYENMADIMKKPTSTIGTLLRRAKQTLKQTINHEKITLNHL